MSSGTVLRQASHEWATRPADQRFASLEELHAAVTHHREVAVEARSVPMAALSVEAREIDGDAEPVIVSPSGQVARLNHFSFGQLANRVSAPAGYLRKLSAALAVANLNEGLQQAEDRNASNNALLFAENGGLRLRAITSDGYRRIWNSDLTSRLIRLADESGIWQPAPAAFDGSRGLYASDKDMFAFLVDSNRRIFETAPGGGLSRGFFLSNSEVGDASFRLTTFAYNHICGNHMVWGASGITEIRIPHIGDADARAFSRIAVEVKRYAEGSAQADEQKIASAMRYTLGGTKDEVLDKLFGLGINRKLATQSYDLAVEHEDWYGNPNSAWGVAGGMTEIARDKPNADERVDVERTAGKVMQLAWK